MLTFYQSPYHQWHYSTVQDSAIYDLPIGTQFQTINAPIPEIQADYSRTLFEVAMVRDIRTQEMKRSYLSKYTKHYPTFADAIQDDTVASQRYAIVGSRDWPDEHTVIDYVNALSDNAVVISGGACGVDSIAEQAAMQRGLEVVVYPAEWEKYGKSAGFRRNVDIVNDCDILVAFSYQNSKGTAHSIKLAEKVGKRVVVFRL